MLSASDVRELYDWDLAIESQRQAFAQLGLGAACLPEKLVLPAGENMALCYAARMSDDTGAVSKFISVHPHNGAKGLPSVQSVVTALDPVDGRPIAIIDGNEVTTRRTAAASALAISLLKSVPAHVLTVLGSGVQGMAHIRAIRRVHRFDQVRIWSPTRANRERAAETLLAELGIDVVAYADAQSAVEGASVIVTCTSSEEPVLRGDWLSPGATVLSVGSFTETRSEIDTVATGRASVLVVDHVPTEVAHGGLIVSALRRGERNVEDLVPLSDVVLGRHPGRRHRDEIIVYNSVGVGVQDAAAAWALIDRARQAGRGTRIAL
ncbi:ornithine cyclodeaminase family protein [Pendulispora albinea]|uniref:Ornithine cyclodeaminase family protein n=1 Tax=Pendulispora albinea TaxID=2741071 RepID=A0ABZ2M328_9BACT